MNFFKRIFSKKKVWKQHSFTSIVASGERIVIFCSENSYHTAMILSYVSTWKDRFKQISIILPDYDHAFFSKIDMGENTTYFNIINDIKPFDNAVIFNFSSSKKIRKTLNRCNNSTILGIDVPANLQFLPAPTNPIYLLKKFADFFDFAWQKQKLYVDTTKSELVVAKHQFIKNNFKNFILDFSNDLSAKNIGRIVQIVKHEFSANIYFTGKRIPDKDFINMEEINLLNLLELYDLAKVSDLLITDKREIAGAFADLDVAQIYIGYNIDNTQIKCIEITKIDNIKNVIYHFINK